MRDPVESRSGPPDHPRPVRSHKRTLPHCLPRCVLKRAIVDTALHRSAARANPVSRKRPGTGVLPDPFMCKQTTYRWASGPHRHNGPRCSRSTFRNLSVTRPAATKSPRMRQLIERGRRSPEKPVSPWRNVGALSQRLPDNVTPERIENTALHLSALLAASVGNDRVHVKPVNIPARFRMNGPLVYEQAAPHHCAPSRSSAGMRCVIAWATPERLAEEFLCISATSIEVTETRSHKARAP